MKTKLGNTIIATVLAAVMIFSIGCSDDDEESILNPGSSKNATVSNLVYGQASVYAPLDNGAMLRAVHASPDAPAVDIYVEGGSGSYTVELRPAGANSNTKPVFEIDVTIPEDVTVTAVATGLFGSSDDADKFRILPYVETFADPGAGNAAVRVIHASPDAPTVALDVGDDGNPNYENLARFGETGSDGLPLPADTELQIAIWANGERVTAFTTPQLPEGADLFVIATGLLLTELPRETDGFSLLAIAPSGSLGFIKQNPVVFALHGSPDAGAVDIFAGSTELASDLVFAELSRAIQVPPGAYDLRFEEASGAQATFTTPALAAGERYLAIASGFLSPGANEPEFLLLPYGESFGDAGADALVRVIHASPDAPTVNVGTVSGNTVTPVPDFTNLSFEDASTGAGTVLPVGTLPIGLSVPPSSDAAVEFTVTTAAGLKAFAVAAGSLNSKGEDFRLVIVNATNFPWVAQEVAPN